MVVPRFTASKLSRELQRGGCRDLQSNCECASWFEMRLKERLCIEGSNVPKSIEPHQCFGRRFIPFSIEDLCETIEWRTRFEDIMFGQQDEIPILHNSKTTKSKTMFRSIFSFAGAVVFATALFINATDSQGQEYSLTIEATSAVTEGLTTYRFYVDMNDATDRMSAVFGNDEYPLEFNAPEACSTVHSTRVGMPRNQPRIFGCVSRIGRRHLRHRRTGRPCFGVRHCGAADPAVVEDAGQPITPFSSPMGRRLC